MQISKTFGWGSDYQAVYNLNMLEIKGRKDSFVSHVFFIPSDQISGELLIDNFRVCLYHFLKTWL